MTTRSSAGDTDDWRAVSGGRIVLENRRDQPRVRVRHERPRAGEHLVEHGAERKQIASRVGFPAAQLLG